MAEHYNRNLNNGFNNNRSYQGNNNTGMNNNVKLVFNDKDEIGKENDKAVNYVDIAKDVIEKKLDKDKNGNLSLTTSQIRNLLSLLAEIYKSVLSNESNELNDDLKAKIQYFRLKCVYQAGREPLVKNFLEKSGLLELINLINDNKKRFINYYHYMESLVAWHRYDGGKDK